MKGQSAIEYLMLVGVLIVLVLPFAYIIYGDTQVKNNVEISKLAVSKIAKAANLVYAQGPGARTTIRVYLPNGVINITTLNQEVRMNMTATGGQTTLLFEPTYANLTNSQISSFSGIKAIQVEYNETTKKVAISEAQ
jgi:uncharacterized protein (UPF0333 family)